MKIEELRGIYESDFYQDSDSMQDGQVQSKSSQGSVGMLPCRVAVTKQIAQNYDFDTDSDDEDTPPVAHKNAFEQYFSEEPIKKEVVMPLGGAVEWWLIQERNPKWASLAKMAIAYMTAPGM
jgi:hypothetical protein